MLTRVVALLVLLSLTGCSFSGTVARQDIPRFARGETVRLEEGGTARLEDVDVLTVAPYLGSPLRVYRTETGEPLLVPQVEARGPVAIHLETERRMVVAGRHPTREGHPEGEWAIDPYSVGALYVGHDGREGETVAVAVGVPLGVLVLAGGLLVAAVAAGGLGGSIGGGW